MNKGLKAFALVGLAACTIGAASALASCDNRDKLVIWAAEEVLDLTKTQVNRFVNEATDFPYKLQFENVSESNAVSNVLNDVTAAGDVFFFANDQLARVVQSGALSPVPSDFLDDVIERNAKSAVDAGYVGNTLYAYPVTNDNGYFAFYDKSLLSADDMTSQEKILAKLDSYYDNGSDTGTTYTISFELVGSGWYNFAYFYGAGANSLWYTDDDGVFTDRSDTYNSNAGKDALLGMQQLIGSRYFVDNSTASTGFAQDAAIVVSGTWDSADVAGLLGDNYAAAPLWEVTVPSAYAPDNGTSGGSHTYHLGSFSGCKFVGVRVNEDGEKNMWAHEIANYLTSEECQVERFEANGWGPSNLVAASDERVTVDPAIVALTEQSDYAQVQGQYPDIWWTATSAMGAAVQAAASSTMDSTTLQKILDDYDATCDGYLNNTISGYAVVGDFTDASWDNAPSPSSPYLLYEDNAETGTYSVDADGTVHGVWEVEIPVTSGDGSNTLTINSEETAVGNFRVVDYMTWEGNYGYTHLTDGSLGYKWTGDNANNISLPDGTYNLKFDYSGTTPAITITAVSQ